MCRKACESGVIAVSFWLTASPRIRCWTGFGFSISGFSTDCVCALSSRSALVVVFMRDSLRAARTAFLARSGLKSVGAEEGTASGFVPREFHDGLWSIEVCDFLLILNYRSEERITIQLHVPLLREDIEFLPDTPYYLRRSRAQVRQGGGDGLGLLGKARCEPVESI